MKAESQKFICILLVALMLNLSLSPAFGQELPASVPIDVDDSIQPDTGDGVPKVIDSPIDVEFACFSPESERFPGENTLLPSEVAALKRKTEVEMTGSIICFLLGAMNVFIAMTPPHTVSWLNWLSAGFCFGCS